MMTVNAELALDNEKAELTLTDFDSKVIIFFMIKMNLLILNMVFSYFF